MSIRPSLAIFRKTPMTFINIFITVATIVHPQGICKFIWQI